MLDEGSEELKEYPKSSNDYQEHQEQVSTKSDENIHKPPEEPFVEAIEEIKQAKSSFKM